MNNKNNKGVDDEFTPLNKKEILRKCAGCGISQNRDNMIKVTRCSVDKQIKINPDNKTFGRSAYLCYNIECINNVFKKKRLQKILKTNINEDFADKLKKIVD